MTSPKIIALLALSVAATACAEQKKSPSPGTTSTAAKTTAPSKPKEMTAQEYYDNKCVVCHGKSGKGDGVGAKALDPKPRDFSDPEWQKSVEDDYIRKIIVKGGAAVGKSAGMAANPDLEGKEELQKGLVKIVRGFGKKE